MLEDDFILAEGDWLDPADYNFQVHRTQEPPVLPNYQFVGPTRIQREARLLADELEYLAESSNLSPAGVGGGPTGTSPGARRRTRHRPFRVPSTGLGLMGEVCLPSVVRYPSLGTRRLQRVRDLRTIYGVYKVLRGCGDVTVHVAACALPRMTCTGKQRTSGHAIT